MARKTAADRMKPGDEAGDWVASMVMPTIMPKQFAFGKNWWEWVFTHKTTGETESIPFEEGFRPRAFDVKNHLHVTVPMARAEERLARDYARMC